MIIQFIIIQVIVFGAVIFFLRKILYGDTESAIHRLGHVHRDLLKKQAELTQKIEEAEKQYITKKDEAEALADKAMNQALEESRKKEDEILKKARTEGDDIISKAQGAREEITREIATELKRNMINHFAELFKTIFNEQLIQMVHEEFVKEFIARAKDFDLSNVDVTVQDLIVRTAVPLKKEESDKLNALLITKLNRPITYHEVADPDLIAGVVLQFGTLLLEGNLASSVKEAADRAKEKV